MAELRTGGGRAAEAWGSEDSVTSQSWPQVLLLKMTDVSQEALSAPLERPGMADFRISIVLVTNVA